MTDVFSKEKRSWIMGRIKSKGNRSTEKAFVAILREHKISGWRRNYDLLGKPDIVFPKAGVAVFLDGCFWHGCPIHLHIPKTNKDFWRKKIFGNMARDRRVSRQLRKQGWHVFRFWEHDIARKIIGRKLGRLRRIVESE